MALRVARCLIWLSIVLAGLYAVIVLVALSQGFPGHPPHPGPDDGIPMPALFALAGFIAAIVASIFARALSEENEGHLPVVWTLPVSRSTSAIRTFAVGAVGILGAFAIALVALMTSIATFQMRSFVYVPEGSALQLVRYIAFPFAFYGLLTALSASFGKIGRALTGWGWVGAFLLGALSAGELPQPWTAIFRALDLINPMHYADYSTHSGSDTINVMGMPGEMTHLSIGTDIAALSVLALAGLAAGIWQWNRVEA
jgi:hypothetical protein